jgi:hypothetical protein
MNSIASNALACFTACLRWCILLPFLTTWSLPTLAQSLLDQPSQAIMGQMQVWQARQEIDPVLAHCKQTAPQHLDALRLAAQHYLELAQEVQKSFWTDLPSDSDRRQKLVAALQAKPIPEQFQKNLRFQILDIQEVLSRTEKIPDADLCTMMRDKWKDLEIRNVKYMADQIYRPIHGNLKNILKAAP